MKDAENFVATNGATNGDDQAQQQAEALELAEKMRSSGFIFTANVNRYVSFAEIPEIMRQMSNMFEDDFEIKIEKFWEEP
jgi:hypothetical protein